LDIKNSKNCRRCRQLLTVEVQTNLARNRFLKDVKVDKIDIGTEEIPPREGENRSRMVSTIEIKLSKK